MADPSQAAVNAGTRDLWLEMPDGVRLEARHVSGAEPTLVFLHEGLGSAGLWRTWPERFAAATGRGAFAYSRRGYGRSDPRRAPWPHSYLDDEAAALDTVCDRAGLGKVVLIGHSDGGSIALGAAARDRARRVQSLVLFAPHVTVERANVAAIRATGERYRSGDLRERLARHHNAVDDVFNGWLGVWTDAGFASWSLLPDLGRVTAPTLVVQGLADPYGSEQQARLILGGTAGFAAADLLAGCGHDPLRDRGEATFAAAVTHIQRFAVG